MKMITNILFSIAESLLFDCLSWQCLFSLVKADLKIVNDLENGVKNFHECIAVQTPVISSSSQNSG